MNSHNQLEITMTLVREEGVKFTVGKVAMIKAVREASGLGIAEAKAIVEAGTKVLEPTTIIPTSPLMKFSAVYKISGKRKLLKRIAEYIITEYDELRTGEVNCSNATITTRY